MPRNLRKPVLVILGLALVACATLVGWLFAGVETVNSGFVTAAVERRDLRAVVLATGRVDVVQSIRVGSQLSGQVSAVLVDYNDLVQSGQPLARLDQRSQAARVRALEAERERMRAEVALAEARVAGAQARARESAAELARRSSLHASDRLSTTELERAEADSAGAASDLAIAEAQVLIATAGHQRAESNLLEAQLNLERMVIRAPVDGVVIGREVEEGQTVAATLEAPTLFTIARDLREMEVHARVDEADIGSVRPGQQASFTVDAFPEEVFPAIVSQVRKAPEIVSGVVTYTVVLETANPEGVLLPGMTAIVEIITQERPDVLALPAAALRFRPEASGGALEPSSARVWVLRDERPMPVDVDVGMSDGSMFELESAGLALGERVVVAQESEEEQRRFFGLRFGR